MFAGMSEKDGGTYGAMIQGTVKVRNRCVCDLHYSLFVYTCIHVYMYICIHIV